MKDLWQQRCVFDEEQLEETLIMCRKKTEKRRRKKKAEGKKRKDNTGVTLGAQEKKLKESSFSSLNNDSTLLHKIL